MGLLAATLLSVWGAVNVWTESPLVRVFPSSVPTAGALKDGRIHAARGERESFQLCIRAGNKELRDVRIEAEPVSKMMGPPEVRRVGYLQMMEAAAGSELGAHPQTSLGVPPGSFGVTSKGKKSGKSALPAQPAEALWPDPLLDLEPFHLAPGETAALWVTYAIPRDARPGSYNTAITVRCGEKRKYRVNVSVEVFAFTLPETPSLRTAFTLDRKSIRSMYGIDDTPLEPWKPIYDAFAQERIAFRVWDGSPLVVASRDGPADTTRFKEHLEYAVAAAHMNTVDIGSGQNGIRFFPAPPPGVVQDPLQYYLHDMGNWLQDRGWLDRAFVEVMALPDRAKWQIARDAYFRVKRNDKRIKRLLVGAGDPYFERYTDIWATPLRHFDPYVDSLLRQGLSLRVEQPLRAKTVTASSSTGIPGDALRTSQPEDAYDGCLFTFWISKGIPKRSDPEWLQVDLAAPVTTNTIKIIWKRGFEATDITLETILDGRATTPPEVQWRPFPPVSAYAQSWAEATFPSPQTFQSIRFEFGATYLKGPVGVTELLFGEAENLPPPERIEPLELWLSSMAPDFPSFGVRAHPVEARMAPWVCWGLQSAGFVHRGLCRWPVAWRELANTQPLIWPAAVPPARTKSTQDAGLLPGARIGEDFLFYPGRAAPISSIRSELLRDGMEDYEYLAALDRALTKGDVKVRDLKTPDAARLCERRMYPCNPAPVDLDNWARMVLTGHLRMGWALDQIEKERQP